MPLFRRNVPKHLQSYLFITIIHGLLQGYLLGFGVPIFSRLYGGEWYGARILQLVFAFLFVSELTSRYRRLMVGLLASIAFSFTALPIVWFGWLAFGYAFLMLVLGVSVVGKSRIMGLYWISTGAFYYVFLRMSVDQSSIIWRLNWWLPSTISIVAFLALAADHRSRK